MTTSSQSRTAPLAAVPTLPLFRSLVSVPQKGVKAILMHTLEILEPAEQTYYVPSYMPTWFSWKSIYTPFQDWDGYR